MLLSSQWLESQGYLLLLQDDWTRSNGSAGLHFRPGVEWNNLLDCTDAQNRAQTSSILPPTSIIIVWAVTLAVPGSNVSVPAFHILLFNTRT
jgi:hypothetical protein